MDKSQVFEIREKCGVVGVWTTDTSAPYIARHALAALQHRGQESAGLSVLNANEKISTYKKMGLVPHVLTESVLKELGTGHTAIAQNRYATFGKSHADNAQPITITSGKFHLSLGHNGNIPNVTNIKTLLGLKKSDAGDTELMTMLIHKERKNYHSWEETLVNILPEFHGAYCLVILTNDGSLFAARDPLGIRPLSLGKLENGWIIASETVAFDAVGADFVRDIKNGEIIKITAEGTLYSYFFGEPTRPQYDLFEYVYFARPDSFLNGRRVREGREASGRALGKRIKRKQIHPDVVIPIFDSGYPAAKGVSQVLGLSLTDAITTSHYVGRTFIQPGQENRAAAVNGKHNTIADEVYGRNVIFVDDSAVRLTTSKALVQELRNAGAKEVYMGVASSPVVNQCDMGIDMRDKKSLPAAKYQKLPFAKIEENIAKEIGADAVVYLPIEETTKAMGGTPEDFYHYPFGGPHPLREKQSSFQKSKKKIKGNPRLCVLISGSGTNLQNFIDHIQNGTLNAEIVSVISNKKDAYGLIRAQKHSIPTVILEYSGNLKDQEKRKQYEKKLIKEIKKSNPDVILLSGWMFVLSNYFLKKMQHMEIPVINQHPTLLTQREDRRVKTSRGNLPTIRGTHGIEETFEKNVPVSGITAHQVLPSEMYDVGPVIMKAEVKRKKEDTPDTWEKRVRDTEYALLPSALNRVFHVMKHNIDISKGDFPWESIKRYHDTFSTTFSIIGLGAMNMDIIHKSANDDNSQSAVILPNSQLVEGGAAGNILYALAKLGLNCGLVGKVGMDEYGNMLLDSLHEQNIDTSQIIEDKQQKSGQCYSFVNTLGKRNTYVQSGANSNLEFADINLNYFKDTQWVNFSNFVDEKQLYVQTKIARELARDVRTSLWLDGYILPFGWNAMKDIFPFIDTLFIRESTLQELTHLSSKEGAKKIIYEGVKLVAVIKSASESEITDTATSYSIKTQSTYLQDETGISCAFASGFLYGQIQGYNTKKSALLGNSMMSFCAESFGARSQVPTLTELMQRTCLIKEDKNILIIGSGGREHALAWKLHQSPRVHRLYVAPGNPGISQIAHTVPIKETDINSLKNFVKDKDIDITIVGPEAPLAQGLTDAFEKEGLNVFGPSKKAAALEISKTFSKNFMKKCNIPTATFKSFTDYKKAMAYLKQIPYPVVIKADGLAAGKGVLICPNKSSAEKALKEIMVDKQFGAAGEKVVIEEFLEGEEASILAFSDGEHVIPLIPSQDHKRMYDNDEGPNTGGMGAYAPASIVDTKLLEEITRTILEPTIKGMKQIGRPYKGVLYAGIMITKDGPKVLEFNARFGDPETQAVLPLMKTDLLEAIEIVLLGQLDTYSLEWENKSCVCIVMASGGYPVKPETGKEVHGLTSSQEDYAIFHAGTRSKIITSGGRVLGVVSTGEDLQKAITKAYQGVNSLSFENMQHRKDIGKKGLKKNKNSNGKEHTERLETIDVIPKHFYAKAAIQKNVKKHKERIRKI